MGKRNSCNTEGMIQELARRTYYCSSHLWLRGFSDDPKIVLLNRATSSVQEKGYLETRIPGGFGSWDFPSYRFPELVSDIFDVWRNGSPKERFKIFGANAAELEGRVECATLTSSGEFRVWYDLPSYICNRTTSEDKGKPIPHVSEGSKKMLFDVIDTSKVVNSLSAFLNVFEDFGRCKTYPLGVIVFSPRDYKVRPHELRNAYLLERGE
ncbi:hypothetical protein HYX11_01790 [Candidatus Woesearchaeota archaeon]|nr:hypothetical protein [Candidatus Woesearchaeota archaeon]